MLYNQFHTQTMERTQDHVVHFHKEVVVHQTVILKFLLLACTSHHALFQLQMVYLVIHVMVLRNR